MTLKQIKDLNFQHFSTQTNKLKRKNGNIVVYTYYVSIHTYKFKECEQGTKVTVTVEKNYQPKQQSTIYFDLEGKEISKTEFYPKGGKKLSTYLIEWGYEINKEFSGNNLNPYVLRFRGDFIKSYKTIKDANIEGLIHLKNHRNNLK